jgi:flagellum-specific peptidoglycan hydrolase FlgJ
MLKSCKISFRLIIVWLGVLLMSGFFSQLSAQSKVVARYIEKYTPLADSLSLEFGIPVSIIIGVAIVESSSGTGRNARLLNNHFGIVGKNNLLKTKGIRTKYKQYPDAESSFVDFCKLISRRKFYADLRGNSDYRLWVDAISKSAYSEVPQVWKREILYAIRNSKLEERGVVEREQ